LPNSGLLADLVRRFIVFAHRLVIGLSRPKSGQRLMIGVLVAYWAIWTLYGIIAKSSQGIHTDMGEVVAWSWNLDWGTPKHPPFLPALVRAWFAVFPLDDWAYYLLAVGLVAVAIYFSWLLAGFWLRGPKRAAVPFLLMLVPFYNFLALRLDHNVVLIPLWAVTTYAFARAVRTHSVIWSVVTGVAAGAAVLAKYWSFFLLFGLVVAVLVDRRRLQFLKSPAPWIMTAVSFGLSLPHLIWLEANGYPTLVYARHRFAESWSDLADALANYTGGAIAYVAVPLVLLAILVKPPRQALRDTLLPADADRRFAAVMFWTPLLVAIPFALLTSTSVNALWTMSELSLFGVVLLSSPLVQFKRSAAAVVAMVAIVTSCTALLASPFVALWKNQHEIENHAAYTRELATEVVRVWREATAQPLRYVASDGVIAYSVTFYIDSHPLPISLSSRTRLWWGTAEEIDRSGVAIVCPPLDAVCSKARDRIESGRTVARRVDVVILPHWLGFSGAPRSYAIDIVPPRAR
jgi:4-amino-4-deoxy-L-arabinose transferase-like glycosyltransferase